MTTRTDANADIDDYPGAPRWVKVFGIIALMLLLFVILRLTGVVADDHGPGRHIRVDHAGSQTAPASAEDVEDHAPSDGADRHTPPERGH